MALSPSDAQLPNSDEIDRLSHLPDELLLAILSLLPTHLAARTSLLSRRFRRLWEASPSLEIIFRRVPYPGDNSFASMADRLLLSRSSSHPLLSLRLGFQDWASSCIRLFSRILEKVPSFVNLRHLTLEFRPFRRCYDVLPDIFSMASLESLSIADFRLLNQFSATSLTRLRSLSLGLNSVNPNQFHQLISELCSLEELHLNVIVMEKLSISSKSIRKLKLIIVPHHTNLNVVTLCLPSLDLFYVEHKDPRRLAQFIGKISNLRKAVLTLHCVRKEDCSFVAGLMDTISNVEELILHIKEDECEKNPFPILLEPGKEAPYFSNMKHLEATMGFHMHNFEAIVSILHHSTALESVKLVHEVQFFTFYLKRKAIGRKRKDWRSKLPRNADRNHCYTYFRNLHLGVQRKEFMKTMSKKCTSRNQAGY